MIVVDASAALELILRSPASKDLRVRLLLAGDELHAPHLIDLEILQVIRRMVRIRALSVDVAAQVVDAWSSLEVVRYPHIQFADRVFQLRDNFTAYDAAYIALAEALDAPLVTHDAKFQKAGGHQARIELI